MRDALPEFEKRDAKLVIIGNGAPHFIDGFRKELNYAGPIYVDPDLHIYRELGFRSGVKSILNPKQYAKAFSAWTKGFKQTATAGDAFQLGGVIIFDKAGRVIFEQKSSHAGDHPPIESLLQAIDLAHTSQT